jgi:predicted DNA-binding transcriptional regulator AlpA
MMVTMATSADDLITSSQAGAILGKSARTVSRLAEQGKLPYETRLAAANGVYLFKRSVVEEYAAERAERTA